MDRLFRDVNCLGSVDELRGIGVDIHILDQDGGTLDTFGGDPQQSMFAELEMNKEMKHLKVIKVFTGPGQGHDIVPNWGNRTPLTIDIETTSKDGPKNQ